MNRPALQMMEVEEFERGPRCSFLNVSARRTRPVIASMIDAARNGQVTRHTLFGPTAKGNPRWWDFTLAPVRDAEGSISRLLAMSHDVTETHLEPDRGCGLGGATGKCPRGDAPQRHQPRPCVPRHGHEPSLHAGTAHAARRARQGCPGFSEPDEIGPFLEQMLVAMEHAPPQRSSASCRVTAKWYEVQADCRSEAITVFFRDVTAGAKRRIALPILPATTR